MSNDEIAEILVECWRDRADTYERLGHEQEAIHIRLCADELESFMDL